MFVILKGKVFYAGIKSLAAYDEKNVHKSDYSSAWFFLLAYGNHTRSLKHSAKIKNKKNIIYKFTQLIS